MATQQVEIGLGVVSGSMNGITTAMVGMNELVSTIDQATMRFAQAFGDVDIAIVSLAAAIGAVQFKAMEAFGEFERGMAVVQAVSGSTATEIGILGDAADQLSVKFNVGITDVTDGLATLGRAGIGTVTDQLEILDQGFRMAKVSGDSLATTLENIVQITSTLGGDMDGPNFTEQTEQISNLLTATSLSGPLTIKDVVQTVQYSGGTAAAGGINVDNMDKLTDYMGAIAAFAQKGVTGSMAGTALRAFFTKPASQDSQVTEGLSAIGLSPYALWEDGGEKMKDISEQIAIIRAHMKGLSQMKQINIWGKIVGPKMGQQMMKLTSDKITDTANKIKQQASMDDLANQAMAGFSTSLDKLKKQFEVFFRGLGENSAKALTPLLQFLTKVMEFFSNPYITGGLGIMLTSIMGVLAAKAIPLAKELKNTLVGAYHSLTDKYNEDSKLMGGKVKAYTPKDFENQMYSDPKNGILKSSTLFKGIYGDEKNVLNLRTMSEADREMHYNKLGLERDKIMGQLLADEKKLKAEAQHILSGGSYKDTTFIKRREDAEEYLTTGRISNPAVLQRLSDYQVLTEGKARNKGGYNVFLNDFVQKQMKLQDFGDLKNDVNAQNKFRKVIGQQLKESLFNEVEKSFLSNSKKVAKALNAEGQNINTSVGRYIYNFSNLNKAVENEKLSTLSKINMNSVLQKGIIIQEKFVNGQNSIMRAYQKLANMQNAIAAATPQKALEAMKNMKGFATDINAIQERVLGFGATLKEEVNSAGNTVTSTMGKIKKQFSSAYHYIKLPFMSGYGTKAFMDRGLLGAVYGQYKSWSNSIGIGSPQYYTSPADGLSRLASPLGANKNVMSAPQKVLAGLGSLVGSFGSFELATMGITMAITAYTQIIQAYQQDLSKAKSEFDSAMSTYSEKWVYFDEKFKEENPEYESELDIINNRAQVWAENLDKVAADFQTKAFDDILPEDQQKELEENTSEEEKNNKELYKNTIAMYKATADVRDAARALGDKMDDFWFGYDGVMTKIYEKLTKEDPEDQGNPAITDEYLDKDNYYGAKIINSILGGIGLDYRIPETYREVAETDEASKEDLASKYYDNINDQNKWLFSTTVKNYELGDVASSLLQLNKEDSKWSDVYGYGQSGTYKNKNRGGLSDSEMKYFDEQSKMIKSMPGDQVATASAYMDKDQKSFAALNKAARQLAKDPKNKELQKLVKNQVNKLNTTMGTNFTETQMLMIAQQQQLADIKTIGDSLVYPAMLANIEAVETGEKANVAAADGTTGQEAATTAQVALIASQIGAMIMAAGKENLKEKYERKYASDISKGKMPAFEDWYMARLGEDINQMSEADRELIMNSSIGQSFAYAKGLDYVDDRTMLTARNYEGNKLKDGNQIKTFGDFLDLTQDRLTGIATNALNTQVEGGALDALHNDEGSGGGGGSGSGKGSKDKDSSSKKSRVDLVLCNKKEIPKLNVNLFKKEPTFTILNKNFKMGDMKINTQDTPKSIMNSVKNAIISTQERMDPKIIRSEEGQYDPVAATDGTKTPSGSNTTN